MVTYVYVGTSTCAWAGRVGKEKGPKRWKVSIIGNQEGNSGIMRGKKRDYTEENNEKGR